MKNFDPWLTATNRLYGNFAHVHADPNDTYYTSVAGPVPSGADEIPPAGGNWNYVHMPRPAATGQNCPPVGCSWEDGNPSFSWTVNRNQAGAQLFYFVNRFHDYLRDTPGIAFGPTSGNFEGADRVLAQVDNGAGVSGGFPDCGHANNAAMNVLPDGLPGLMEMYLWSGSCDLGVRDVNGSDDAYIVYHEYTHGLSFRLITDANGVGALNTQAASQSGAMSEGWSDWYAKDYLVASGFEPDTAAPGEVRGGVYENVPTCARRRSTAPWARLRRPVPDRRAPAPAATPTVTSAGSSAFRRSTPTERSGSRRSGTCAPRSSPPTEATA